MANRVTIDVEARFVDRVTIGMNSAAKSSDKLAKSAEKANKELEKVAKKTVKPKLGADDNAFTKKIRAAQAKADKLGKTKVSATLGAIDKASAKIGQVTGAARAFGSKTFKSVLSMSDKASHVIGTVTGAARSFAGKTFSAAVKIVDYATTPLRKIKDSLFSIKTLIGTIVAGAAMQKITSVGVLNPLNLADSYSSAKIGFSTLLGESEGQKMMDKLDQFAKETPFKTSGVIANAQKMMAMGWDAENIIEDMETIGNAAAATGKMDQGLESIVRALAQIKTKGKLSTEELNQLAEAGISAKAMLAEQLGYGTGDKGIAAMTEDLEDGAIASDKAIEALLAGMKKYDGVMQSTANETVEGLKSQLEDTFEINILRRWGQGLQDGAKKGLGTVLDLLNSSEDALADFGDVVYDIGKEISNWGADKLENFVERVKEITQTQEFKDASLGGKIKLLFEGSILDPLKEWWNSEDVQSWIEEKKEWLSKKAAGWGESLGRGLSNGLLALLGVDVTDAVADGIDIGSSFAKGFAEGFDGSAVTDALVEAIGNVWDALPTWAKFLVGGYVGGKAISGIGNVISGVANIAGLVKGGGASLLGSTGNAMVQGTGLLNILANTGYALTGGAAVSTLTPAMAAGAGAGALTAGVTAVSAGRDVYRSYKAYKEGNMGESKASAASGVTKLGGVATGAAIGATIGGIPGALIGAGIGGVAGWIGGSKWAEKIRKETEAAKWESEEMQKALKDSETSAEEMQKAFESACWEDMKNRFGDIELSMEEITALAKNTVYGENAKSMEKFAEATAKAEQSIATFKSAASDIDRLNFDMSQHSWKLNMGIGEKLSDTDIQNVKARVQNYIDSAEQVLADEHYEFNAAVDVLIKPKEGEDDSTYNSIIENGNTIFAQLQSELDSLTEDLTAKYNLYLEDGEITLDEQGTLTRIQEKIAEIIEKVSNAETEATFQVAKMKFTMGDLTPESFEAFQQSLQTQLDSYILEQDQALTLSISKLLLQKEEGAITQEQYDEQLQALLDGYNSNIETMTANVNKIQLEGIAEAFDGVGTVEELQTAINELLAEGEDPLDITFSDINAKLDIGEDVLSEEAKANFTSIMQSAIASMATGENALKTTAEVDPELSVNEESLSQQNAELQSYLSSQLSGSEDEPTTIIPMINVSPSMQLEEGAGESLKSEVETTVSSYLTGENSLTTTANVHSTVQMYGSEGTALSDEANKGRSTVKSAIDTSMTDPFSTTAKANVTLSWAITNPNATVSLSGSGKSVSASISATNNFNGGIVTGGPQLSWLDEEGMGEAVIPFNPSRRARALQLFAETGRRLGVKFHAEGGIVGGDSEPIRPYDNEISTGSGEQKIEINMGGVNIEIKADPNKSMVENIEDQEQAIAEKVAAIFKSVLSAQFANMPAKGGA